MQCWTCAFSPTSSTICLSLDAKSLPAVLTFHELVREGVPVARLAFALCKIGTDAEEAEARSYIAQAGFYALAGFVPERPAYRQAQNQGFSITETRFPQLNRRADKLLQSIVERIDG